MIRLMWKTIRFQGQDYQLVLRVEVDRLKIRFRLKRVRAI